jgi:hypothetical protein
MHGNKITASELKEIPLFNTSRRSYGMTASVVWWSEFLATDPGFRVLFSALPHFLRSSGSGTGTTQLREYN